MHAMFPRLKQTDFPTLTRDALTTLQINLGYLCNQTCLHCHVNAGPKRKELMEKETVDLLLRYIDEHGVEMIDLTGGAPEMNPHFRYLVSEARKRGVTVMDRCNLTILSEPGYDGLAEFLADNHVQVVASLPCYLEDNVDAQRGKGVFGRSIDGLQKLNSLGYGKEGSGLNLSLVYNPQGPSLPPGQVELQAAYKQHLHEQFGIVFNQLFTIANMPIQRFGSTLISKGQFGPYMETLKNAYREENHAAVMCRSLISVDWQGYVYDCDFNQMLEMPLAASEKTQPHLRDLFAKDLSGKPIAIADHCYGCTAGQGSSCGGALS